VTGGPEGDHEELLRWMQGPASRGLRRASFILIGLAGLVNAANAPNVLGAAGQVHNTMGLLGLFGTHAALALALCSMLVPRVRRLTLTRRGACLGLIFAVLSLAALPVSYAAAALIARGPFKRLF
jgi:hypothetical protein